jgi:hypothetical protein
VIHNGASAVASAAGDGYLPAAAEPGPGIAPALQLKGVAGKYRRGDQLVHALIDFDFILAQLRLNSAAQ